MKNPADTFNTCPVMNAASSEARKSTGLAASSGVIIRPAACSTISSLIFLGIPTFSPKTVSAVSFSRVILVDTRMTREKETADTVFGEKVGIPKKIRDEMVEQAAGRIMTPEDAARPVLFLASDDAAFITGQVLNVSAGFFI